MALSRGASALLAAATSDVNAAAPAVSPAPPAPFLLIAELQSHTAAALLWSISMNTLVGVTALQLFGYLRVNSVYSSKIFRPRQLLLVRATQNATHSLCRVSLGLARRRTVRA